MRTAALLIAACFCSSVFAKLPPPTAEEKAKAADAAAKNAWTEKVGQYQLCMVSDRIAAAYRKSNQDAGKAAPAPVVMPACADPGPYVAPVAAAAKPIEAAGAHSPPATAVSPPSTKDTAAEIAGGKKK